MATVRELLWTVVASVPQLAVMSLGAEQVLTKMAAMEPPW